MTLVMMISIQVHLTDQSLLGEKKEMQKKVNDYFQFSCSITEVHAVIAGWNQ